MELPASSADVCRDHLAYVFRERARDYRIQEAIDFRHPIVKPGSA